MLEGIRSGDRRGQDLGARRAGARRGLRPRCRERRAGRRGQTRARSGGGGMLFRTWWRADCRVVRARRARCFVYRQCAMSRVSARRLHAIVLFQAS
jgi:hypothetical protein